MKIYDLATISAPSDDSAALSAAHTDENGNCPLDWPLKNAKITFNGDTAVITVRQPAVLERGRWQDQKDLRVDRLTDAKMSGHDDEKKPIIVTGTSELIMSIGGFTPEDAMLTFTVEDFQVCPV